MSRISNRRRALIAKVGLDGHDVGARVIARALSDNGMDVAYTGIRRTPEEVARMAVEYEATVVGVSILSGAHMELLPRLRELLDRSGAEDVPIVVGGVIPLEEISRLKQNGVAEVFVSGTPLADIVAYIDRLHGRGPLGSDDSRVD